MFEKFSKREIETGETTIFVRTGGSGRPILLLHGFPETHVMWRDIAPLLAQDFTVVCADLRGYGGSGCPNSDPDHFAFSKRAMARDMISVMQQLHFDRWSVAGHDRGGRVAYRMALDYPEQIDRLAVLDVVPTKTVWDHADARMTINFWPWSFLAQPSPLPEKVLTVLPEVVINNAFASWGSPAEFFEPEVRQVYTDAIRNSEHARAICEEYRAAATLDRLHDSGDLEAKRRIICPVLALWAAEGALDTWYGDEGGPLHLWREWANNVTGRAINGGHFFPEVAARETAQELRRFFS